MFKPFVAECRASSILIRSFPGIQRLVLLMGKPPKGASDKQELEKGNFWLSAKHAFTPKKQKNQNQDADERFLPIHTTINILSWVFLPASKTQTREVVHRILVLFRVQHIDS